MGGRHLILAVALLVFVATAYHLLTLYTNSERDVASMTLTSSAFKQDGRIPVMYTCDGRDVSPPLSWSGAPSGVKTYALIVDDPDASSLFTHWVIFNIPGDSMGLPENVPKDGTLDNGAVQGKNHFGKIGYGGPCPPAGKPHRYMFHLYALDTALSLKPGASREDVLSAIKGHVLANGELTGIYGR